MYNLTFPGRHTVNQVKRDVATVTGIPVFRQVQYLEEHLNISVNDARYIHHQEWTGWPEDTNDELSLLQISLPIVHTLTVTQVNFILFRIFCVLNTCLDFDFRVSLVCNQGWTIDINIVSYILNFMCPYMQISITLSILLNIHISV